MIVMKTKKTALQFSLYSIGIFILAGFAKFVNAFDLSDGYLSSYQLLLYASIGLGIMAMYRGIQEFRTKKGFRKTTPILAFFVNPAAIIMLSILYINMQFLWITFSPNADKEQLMFNDKTALMYATKKNRVFFTSYLLKHGANVNTLNSKFKDAFCFAIDNHNEKIARLLLRHGYDINRMRSIGKNDETHSSADYIHIHTAVKNQDIAAIELLLKLGADIDRQNQRGETALSGPCAGYTPGGPASKEEKTKLKEIAKILLDNNTDINHRDKNNYTPLLLAIFNGYKKLSYYLIERGADIHVVNNYKRNALFFAIQNQDYNLTEMLLQKGISVNIVDKGGYIPLGIAENRKTPVIDKAGRNISEEIVRLLKQYGAKY